MSPLADDLIARSEDIVQRWYEAWRTSAHPHHEIGEAALKNHLGPQLRLIGEQLRDLASAEDPEQMWKVAARLAPEARVEQEIPIEEVVQEYRLAVDVVRQWIEERGIEVPFREASYFFGAVFELAAESVRRYQAAAADQIAKGRAEYLAGVMHQLRTPLGTVSLQVHRLERAGGPGAGAVLKLRRSTKRIRSLVDGILRLERFRPAEQPVRPAEVSPAHVVDEIMGDHEAAAARKGLRFEAHVDRSCRMTVDLALFEDALGNLVDNAVKYTERGFVIVESDDCGDEVTFRVRDSGPGIPAEKRAGLFRDIQPGTVNGTGLGLQIAQHAAEAQGGSISVESEVGRGSTFSMRLPRVVAARG
jgi:signal transduction histidine kinase